MYLSIIVPSYNEEKNILDFYNEVTKVFKGFKKPYEIIFVNDGSRDNTLKELNKLLEKKDNIKVINFSRNFGKEAAMYAGLKEAEGDFVTIIDADLQQNPKYIKQMIKILEDNSEYDAVAAYQEKRKENKLIALCKKIFYKFINSISDVEFKEDASDFRVFRKSVVKSILSLEEYHRFSKGIFSFVGYKTYYMPYKVEMRNAGESKWNFHKLFKYALEGIISFSTSPLRFSYTLSFMFFLSTVIYFIVALVEKLKMMHYLIILILFISSLLFLTIGILGSYLARVYMQSKNRPIYITKSKYESKSVK